MCFMSPFKGLGPIYIPGDVSIEFACDVMFILYSNFVLPFLENA